MKTSYIVTRPALYKPNTPGYFDPKKRRPYFVDASSKEEAIEHIRYRYNLPKSEPLEADIDIGSPF